ncbi:MAG: CDP-diacylglycerol--glycerol-3-phosphate 3-phosphatidyltransferase [Erysipelotrichaceae bacterium]|nr:CDP-diacylglycerol--glycerol-3-phosphate 3-phosphatidyltransferase [Erysipelotrichaceae bacterium]MBR5755284.1 CDP-diacylglycerol--glycerol-3-phosphate 3-phosphatidyltransferase [Erysipelotrichaceae bacterium]
MNLPNKLTLFRVVLVPILALVWLFPYEQFNLRLGYFMVDNIVLPYLNLIVLGIFALASITDYLDGKIARKRHLVTTFGKFADPIADKLLVNMMLIILSYKHMIPLVCCIIMILRDIVVDGCRMIAAQRGVVVSAGLLGKLKTVLQMFTIILVLLNNLPFEIWYLPISEIMIWFTTFISLAGGYSYFMQVKDYIFESM